MGRLTTPAAPIPATPPAPVAPDALWTLTCYNASCRVSAFVGLMLAPLNTCPACQHFGAAVGPVPAVVSARPAAGGAQ